MDKRLRAALMHYRVEESENDDDAQETGRDVYEVPGSDAQGAPR
jgi:hypothetical protein